MNSKRFHLQVNDEIKENTFNVKENELQGTLEMDFEQEQKTVMQRPKSLQVSILGNKLKHSIMRMVCNHIRFQTANKMIQFIDLYEFE